MSDLSDIFPDLPAHVLRDFEQPSYGQYPQGPLNIQGEYAQVTDDDVARYLQSRGALRAPMNPANNSVATDPYGNPVPRQDPVVPQFYNNGRQAPPPGRAIVEAPDYGTSAPPPVEQQQPPQQFAPQVPSVPPQVQQQFAPQPQQYDPQYYQPVPEAPVPQQAPPGQGEPPPVPGQPIPAPPVGQEPPGAPQPPTRQDSIEALAQLWQDDPQLRSIVAQYLTRGVTPPVQPTVPLPQQQGAYLPPPQQPYIQPPPGVQPPQRVQQAIDQRIPQPQFDEYTDPNIRAMWERNQYLEQQIHRLDEQQRETQAAQFQQSHTHYKGIVESVASQFQQKYQIDDETTWKVRRAAANTGIVNSFMNGVDPTNGLPVEPDIAKATQLALDTAFWMVPETRDLGMQRLQQRQAYDNQRKQRLGGVGGSSASVPRNPPPPNFQDPNSVKSAMIADMRTMMSDGYNPN